MPQGTPIEQLHRRASEIHTADVVSFSWRAMLKYHNTAQTSNLLMNRRIIGKSQKRNVQKQMEQLRYCLMQAREYFDAFEAASLATKPLQLYYCCMSLALAEILWKGDGNHNLEKLREKNGHHGLISVFPSRISDDLDKAASSLTAKPFVNNGVRRGTFEVWHLFSRHSPYIGKFQIRYLSGGIQNSLHCIMTPENKRPPLLTERGISLKDCMTLIPGMGHYLVDLGLEPQLIRGRMKESAFEISDKNFRRL